jgi:hypothetical protein
MKAHEKILTLPVGRTLFTAVQMSLGSALFKMTMTMPDQLPVLVNVIPNLPPNSFFSHRSESG